MRYRSGGAIAIAYTVKHPERVNKLVLYGAFPMGLYHYGSPEELEARRALISLTRLGWGLHDAAFCRMFTNRFMPNSATLNAERLAKDARLLFDNGRYASSLALAVLSIEESGKTRIFRKLALARDEKELRECWREYRSHTKKNLLWPLIETFLKGARRAEDFRPLLEPDAEHPYVLDKVKQISIYTDCYKKGHRSIPEEIVEKELAQGLLTAAEVLSQHRDITTEEIDLWIQYLQPYWKTSNAATQQAFFEWDKEMRKRGLLKGDRTTMEKFFTTGIPVPLADGGE